MIVQCFFTEHFPASKWRCFSWPFSLIIKFGFYFSPNYILNSISWSRFFMRRRNRKNISINHSVDTATTEGPQIQYRCWYDGSRLSLRLLMMPRSSCSSSVRSMILVLSSVITSEESSWLRYEGVKIPRVPAITKLELLLIFDSVYRPLPWVSMGSDIVRAHGDWLFDHEGIQVFSPRGTITSKKSVSPWMQLVEVISPFHTAAQHWTRISYRSSGVGIGKTTILYREWGLTREA